MAAQRSPLSLRTFSCLLLAGLLPACEQASPAPKAPPAAKDAALPQELRDAARKIIDAARRDDRAYQRLADLCDLVGHRLAGSPGFDRAVEWATADWKKSGLDDVRNEPVKVTVWERGAESCELVEPYGPRKLGMLGLGNSVGTPPGGLTAPVIVVPDFAALDKLGDQVKGKIVLYNFPMKQQTKTFSAYGEAVEYRWRGAREAAKHGAVAALVRSVTTRSLHTPHTGSMGYLDKDNKDDGTPRIPAAAITVEDAEMLQRLADRTLTPVVHLTMGARMTGEKQVANVVGELRGREKPDEIVVIGGHLDSWDVGSGAHDDGAGVVFTMEALALLKDLGLRPRRTIRGVLFANEERGLDGGRTYLETHRDEVARHVAVMESDSGGFKPVGFSWQGADGIGPRMEKFMPLFAPLGELTLAKGGSGADVGPVAREGVPGFGLNVDPTHYFDYHHTHADTLDKVDPVEFKESLAAYTLMAWLLADMPEPLPRSAPLAAGKE